MLSGAVELAEVGFPVAEVTAHHWEHWVGVLRDAGKELDGDLLIDGQAPTHGQVFRNPGLGRTLRVKLHYTVDYTEDVNLSGVLLLQIKVQI